jgi:hypothetical protein
MTNFNLVVSNVTHYRQLLLLLLLIIWVYSPLLGLYRFFSFLILDTVGWTLGRWISPTQGCYLHTEQHKHRINAHNTDILALSRIRTHDLSVRAAKTVHALDFAATVIGLPSII